ncbi:YdcF family protein [Gymnodinialimonas sp.]
MTAILILGAAVWRDGPSPTLMRRTLHGAALFHAGRGDVVIPCGGLGRFPPSEAKAMADVLRQAGVPDSAIRLEDTSTNTVQNIRNALPLLGDTRDVVIVSDAYHLPRARLIARREGLRVTTSAPPLNGARLWPQVKGWLREIPGVIAVLLRLR